VRAAIVGAVARVIVALALVACGASPETKRAEAAASYAAQQAECIAKHKTREAIDACRDEVKANWRPDAGAEGGSK